MKKHLLILFLSLSFITSNSQSKNENSQESYILTTDGEKIKIAPNEDINYTRFTIEYCTKVTPYGKKKKAKDIGYIQHYYKKTKMIKAKRIEKIVDGDRLYLPFIDNDDKTKIFRLIAKNKNYILGFYSMRFTKGGGTNMSFQRRRVYLIFDHSYKIIKQGQIYGMGMEESKKGVAEIKEYFGECLGRDDNLYDIIKIKGFETNENYSLEKVASDKAYKKYRGYFRSKFLHYQNQIQCD